MVAKDDMTIEDRAFAEAVGAILTAAKGDDLSYTDIAESARLSRAHVVRIMSGSIDARLGDLKRIARLLDLDPYEVLREAEAAAKK